MKFGNLIVDENGDLVSERTGQLIADKNEVKNLYEERIRRNHEDSINEMRKLGLDSNLVLVKRNGKNYHCKPVKQGYAFGKVFRVTLKDIMRKKILSRNALAMIALLEPFIYFPSNSVVIDCGHPTSKDLENLLGLKRTMLFKTLKELEDNEIIKRVKRDGENIIYFNPFLYCAGAYVIEDTFNLFENSKYNIFDVNDSINNK